MNSDLFAPAARYRADVSALEREIDELVYALYALTPEEKALVQVNLVSIWLMNSYTSRP